MHGLGNDFVVAQSSDQALWDEHTIRRLADRRTGIGFDQFLWVEPPRSKDAAAYYRNFNADGSEAEQCGNGARCIAKLLAGSVAEGERREITLEHVNGLSQAIVKDDSVSIALGEPDFRPASLPFVTSDESAPYSVQINNSKVEFDVASIGNPHAVITVSDVRTAPVAELGAALECNRIFPNRANIGFMQVVTSGHVRLRVFERGAGETRACGTGACAAAVVGQRAGWLDDSVRVDLPGGSVTVGWKGPGEPVWLTGEAITVFEGTVAA